MTIPNRSAVFVPTDWSVYAQCYDALTKLKPYQDLVSSVVRTLSPKNDDAILDAGCGTGNLLCALRNECADAVLTGIDFSEGMLSYSKVKNSGHDVVFHQVDMNGDIPFTAHSFSAVTSVNVLYALTHPKSTLKEWYRILKPGGRVVIATPKRGYDNGLILKAQCQSAKPDSYWMNAHASSAREEMLIREAISDESLIQKMLTVAAHNRRIAGTQVFHFYEIPELQALLEECCFTIQTIVPSYANQGILVCATKERAR